jgi:glutaminyl-tRNA synthetase
MTEGGRDSPFRNRSIELNLKLFDAMKNGHFPEGTCVLRAKIDNSSPNFNLRDPTIYRIKSVPHPVTGNKWCIYPMYDFAHALSDAFEGEPNVIIYFLFIHHITRYYTFFMHPGVCNTPTAL